MQHYTLPDVACDEFRAHMTHATVAAPGSGWDVLTGEWLGGRLLIEQVYDHQANIAQGAEPLLVIDAWEHAYTSNTATTARRTSARPRTSSTGPTWPTASHTCA